MKVKFIFRPFYNREAIFYDCGQTVDKTHEEKERA